MAYPASIMNIDPAILKSLAEKLPKNPNAMSQISDSSNPDLKWEYAVVIIAVIEELKSVPHTFPFILRSAAYERLWPYMHVLHAIGGFANLSAQLEKLFASVQEINNEYLDSLLSALAQDMSLFGSQAPESLFLSFEQWKMHDTDKMLAEMNFCSYDFHGYVRGLYAVYQGRMLNGGGNSKEASEGVRFTLASNLTLLQHIHTLEQRIEALEKQSP